MTRRSFLSKENCGHLAGSVWRLRAMNTRRVSCATPIAATCERPDRAAASRYGCMTSMLRSAAVSGTTGMWLASANEATRRRKESPICCRQAADGIGYPRCFRNCTSCPLTCSRPR